MLRLVQRGYFVFLVQKGEKSKPLVRSRFELRKQSALARNKALWNTPGTSCFNENTASNSPKTCVSLRFKWKLESSCLFKPPHYSMKTTYHCNIVHREPVNLLLYIKLYTKRILVKKVSHTLVRSSYLIFCSVVKTLFLFGDIYWQHFFFICFLIDKCIRFA